MFNHSIIRVICSAFLVTGFLAVAGCSQSRWMAKDDTGAYTPGRSIVTDGEHLSVMRPSDDRSGWWRGRNDVGPKVITGYQAPTIETSYERVHDHQSTSNGRVHDNYHSSGYHSRTRIRIR